MTSLFKGKFGRKTKSGTQSSKGPPQVTHDPEEAFTTPQEVESPDDLSQGREFAEVTSQGPVELSCEQDKEDESLGMGPTVEISSIFTGLQLSNKVAKDESSDSPYMKKMDEPQSESSFSFLRASEEGSDEGENSVSLDTSLETGQESTATGFAFLLQPSQADESASTSEDLLPAQGPSSSAQGPSSSAQGPSSSSQSEQQLVDGGTPSVLTTQGLSEVVVSSVPQELIPNKTETEGSLILLHANNEHVLNTPVGPHDKQLSGDNQSSAVSHAPSMAGKKQLPPKGKRIKRRAIRPGQNREVVEMEQATTAQGSSSLDTFSQPLRGLSPSTTTDSASLGPSEHSASEEDLGRDHSDRSHGHSNEVLVATGSTRDSQQDEEKVALPGDISISHDSPVTENSLPLSSSPTSSTKTQTVSSSTAVLLDQMSTGDGLHQPDKIIVSECIAPGMDKSTESVKPGDGGIPGSVSPGGEKHDASSTEPGDGETPGNVTPGNKESPESMALSNGEPPGDGAAGEGGSLENRDQDGVTSSRSVSADDSKLGGVLEVYNAGLKKLRSKFQSSTSQHRVIIADQQRDLHELVQMWHESQVLREREARALADEDYELVEEIRKKLEMAEQRRERTLVLSSMTEICGWIIKLQDGCDSEVAFQESMHQKLQVVKEEHHDSLEKLRATQVSEMSREKLQLQSLGNEVERKAGHIALDRSHWEKRKQLVEEEANHRAAAFIARKKTLTSEMEEIEEEISQLETKLATLRTQRSNILAALAAQDDQIQTVNEEFSEEKHQLHVEDEALQEREQLLTQQQQTLNEQKTSMETIEKRHYLEREKIENHMKEAIVVLNEIQASTAALSLFTSQLQELQEILQQSRNHFMSSTELTICLENERNKKEEVEQKTQEVLEGQASLGATRKKLRDLQENLLELQDSKKAAVTGRQFKEASKFASLVKSASAELAEEEKKMAEEEEAMKTASDSLAQLSIELTACQEQVAQLERKEDEACIMAVLEDIRKLLAKYSHMKNIQSKFSSMGEANLLAVMEAWKKLYLSLAECLSARHSLNFSNMYSENDTDILEQQVTADSTQTDPNTALHPVLDSDLTNTPGSTQQDTTSSMNTAQTVQRCKELEEAIEKACEEEDYDKAAELEEELVRLQEQTRNH